MASANHLRFTVATYNIHKGFSQLARRMVIHVALLVANGVYARMWRLQQDERRTHSTPVDEEDHSAPPADERQELNEARAAAAAATLRSAS